MRRPLTQEWRGTRPAQTEDDARIGTLIIQRRIQDCPRDDDQSKRLPNSNSKPGEPGLPTGRRSIQEAPKQQQQSRRTRTAHGTTIHPRGSQTATANQANPGLPTGRRSMQEVPKQQQQTRRTRTAHGTTITPRGSQTATANQANQANQDCPRDDDHSKRFPNSNSKTGEPGLGERKARTNQQQPPTPVLCLHRQLTGAHSTTYQAASRQHSTATTTTTTTTTTTKYRNKELFMESHCSFIN